VTTLLLLLSSIRREEDKDEDTKQRKMNIQHQTSPELGVVVGAIVAEGQLVEVSYPSF
jgi:hypothetical protein